MYDFVCGSIVLYVYLSEWVRFHVRDWPNSERGSIK